MNRILKSACIVNRENGEIMDKSIQRLLEEPDTEILVVDNNSQDNTKELLKKYDNNPKVKYWIWDIKGASYNRNWMVKHSQGKYILLLDSDVLYESGSFDYLIKRLETAPKIDNYSFGVVGFTFFSFTNIMGEQARHLPPDDSPFLYVYEPCVPCQYGVFLRELFFEHNIWFDENFGVGWGYEDDDFGVQMFQKGFLCATIEFKYYHNKNTEQYRELHHPDFTKFQERLQYYKQKWDTSVLNQIEGFYKKLRGE